MKRFKQFLKEAEMTPEELKAAVIQRWKDKFKSFIASNKGDIEGFDRTFEKFYHKKQSIRGVPAAWLLDYKNEFKNVWNDNPKKVK